MEQSNSSSYLQYACFLRGMCQSFPGISQADHRMFFVVTVPFGCWVVIKSKFLVSKPLNKIWLVAAYGESQLSQALLELICPYLPCASTTEHCVDIEIHYLYGIYLSNSSEGQHRSRKEKEDQDTQQERKERRSIRQREKKQEKRDYMFILTL